MLVTIVLFPWLMDYQVPVEFAGGFGAERLRHAGAVRMCIYIYIILMVWVPGIIGYAPGAGP